MKLSINNINKTVIILTISTSLFIPVFAATTTKTPQQEQNTLTRINNLKQKADSEIDRRSTSLNTLITKINERKKLSQDQKNSFIADIQNEINNLKTLRTKIDADTDITTLRADAKSIIDSFRVYAVYMPKVAILETVDAINTSIDLHNALSTKLDTKIKTAQSQGKDVTAIQTAYSDMLIKLQDAAIQTKSAEAIALNLVPSGFPSNKTHMESARADLKISEQDLKASYIDAKIIISGLKSFNATFTPKLSSSSTLNTQTTVTVTNP